MRILLLFILSFYSFAASAGPLKEKCKFASAEKAQKLLTTEDDFTASWSIFDIESRLKKANGTRSELFSYIKTQTQEWTDSEKAKVESVLVELDKNIVKEGYKLDLPPEIYFLKTTGKEEGDAEAYTRSNYIILKNTITELPDSVLMHLVAHELFHVLSRKNNELRSNMYKIIGFNMTKPVAYPESMKDLRITNPDAVQTDSYITLMKDSTKVDLMMILYAKSKYAGGSFFNYLNFGFLRLNNETKDVYYENGKPVIYKVEDVKNFFETIGNNTQYIIHPEEIMADNFALTVCDKKNLPTQRIIDEIKKELKK